MRLTTPFLAFAVSTLCSTLPSGCDESKAADGAAGAAAAKPASADAEAPQEAAVDPLVTEAVDATRADLDEVRKGLAAGSLAESIVCSDVHRRLPTVEKADPELARQAKKVCDYERPVAEVKMAVEAVETELADNPPKPGRKSMVVACTTSTPSQARKAMEEAGTLDDEAKGLLSRFDELCST